MITDKDVRITHFQKFALKVMIKVLRIFIEFSVILRFEKLEQELNINNK
jgi:hypothetical protein